MTEALDPIPVKDLAETLPVQVPANVKWACRKNCILVRPHAPVEKVGSLHVPSVAQVEQCIGDVLLSGVPEIVPGMVAIWNNYAAVPMPSLDPTAKSLERIIPIDEVLLVGTPPGMELDNEKFQEAFEIAETIGERMLQGMPKMPDLSRTTDA